MFARGLVLLAAISGCDQVWGLERSDEVPEPSGTWRSVTTGERHTCGIRTDGTLWCWGAAEYGQLGVNVVAAATPTQIGTGTWREVSGRGAHTCAIADDRSLWCWGDNGYGQLGAVAAPGPTRIGTNTWEHVDAGRFHTCAIATDTTLWCWGDNVFGQLGDSTSERRSEPTMVDPSARDHWRSVSLGVHHTCGIRDDDSLWCWGEGAYGALADPNLPASQHQLRPNRSRGAWTAVAVGALHTCAISTERRVRCWGYNASGELGDGTTSSSALGVDVGGTADDWLELVAGAEHMCGRRENAGLYCWGDNRHGQIPSAEIGEITSTPVHIAPRFDAWSGVLALGLWHTCLIDEANRLWCAGANGMGQLGRGTGTHFQPTKLDGEWVDAAAGDRMTCALDPARDAYCWGNSTYGAIGDGTLSSRQTPAKIIEPGPWEAISVGGLAACVKRGTSRWCWGGNPNNVIGIPDAPYALFLPKESSDGHFPDAMGTHMCGVTNSELWCWGPGDFGMLGIGDVARYEFPALVGFPAIAWTRVGVGTRHTCGTSSSAVYCWGYNGVYAVGDGSLVDRSMPTAIVDGPVDALAVGYDGGCVIRAGIASCWGFGAYGQLGTGGPGSEPVPRAIGGTWRSIAMAETHACGVAADGTLWCWGENLDGKLGDGTRTSRAQPVQIDTNTDWDRVILGRQHSCALKTDRSLWCWGTNGNGEIGDGTSWASDLQLVD
jgi:alpha-tubulin suppressor-like RCC1 family protein